MLPVCAFLDIDGTIIGDITPQVTCWEILKDLGSKNMPRFRTSLIHHLKNGLVRNGFADFLNIVKRAYPNIEFFIYTASIGPWAAYLIPCIEIALDIKFHRPFFTRNHCHKSNMTKSLEEVMPLVIKSLKRESKYDDVTIDMKSMKNRSFIVDNNDVLVKRETSRWIQAPTYSGMPMIDILSFLDDATITNKYLRIAGILQHNNMLPRMSLKHLTLDAFKSIYYRTMAQMIDANAKSMHHTDQYWIKLANILVRADVKDGAFKDSVIVYVNRKMNKK